MPSEGFADWAAYRAEDRTAAQTAPELAGAVLRGDLPAELPTDEDFGFAGDAARLARAYEGAWMACELIADHWGEEKLFAFYRAVGGAAEVRARVATWVISWVRTIRCPKVPSVPYAWGLTITRSAGARSSPPVCPVVTAAMPR